MKKTFARYISVSILLLVIAILLSACHDSDKTSDNDADINNDNVLYVYNWGEYIDEDVITEFEEETGIDVIYDLFETNEEMYPVVQAGAVLYDVVCPSDYMIQKMIENDMLYELNFANIPNYKNIDEKYIEFSRSFDPDNKYSVPYTWGTVGIIYDASQVDTPPTSWADLWDPKYDGNILMQDSVRDAFMVSEKMLGYSLNETDNSHLKEAQEKLIEQKPLVDAYVVDQVRDKMIGGEDTIGVIYSGELLYIRDEIEAEGEDRELKYIIPKEGSNVWLDSWVIPKNARHKENAEKWIDFLCRADIALKNFEYITYPTPNAAAYELLDDDMKNDTEVFPTDEMLSNCEVYKYLGEDVESYYNTLWNQVKAAQ